MDYLLVAYAAIAFVSLIIMTRQVFFKPNDMNLIENLIMAVVVIAFTILWPVWVLIEIIVWIRSR